MSTFSETHMGVCIYDEQQGRVNRINAAKQAYCDAKSLNGLHYFLRPFSQSLHSTSMARPPNRANSKPACGVNSAIVGSSPTMNAS